MGYSKKLYNVLGGYAYYNTMPTRICIAPLFTNITKSHIYFCAFLTNSAGLPHGFPILYASLQHTRERVVCPYTGWNRASNSSWPIFSFCSRSSAQLCNTFSCSRISSFALV